MFRVFPDACSTISLQIRPESGLVQAFAGNLEQGCLGGVDLEHRFWKGIHIYIYMMTFEGEPTSMQPQI